MNANISANVIEMAGADVVALRDTLLVAVEDVNWTVASGEFWVIGGQQHSGKSDLLMHAAGLIAPARGTCRTFGVETARFDETQLDERLRVGFVFTGGRLFNQLTIEENVALPLQYHQGFAMAAAAKEVAELLDLLELTPFAGATPSTLAANWRQRAALARALILKPDLLLLDNPLVGLSARHRQWLLCFLDQFWRGHDWFGGRPATVVVATDDLRAWQHPRRKFAMLDKKTFAALGAWGDVESATHHAVKDLLAEPMATIT